MQSDISRSVAWVYSMGASWEKNSAT